MKGLFGASEFSSLLGLPDSTWTTLFLSMRVSMVCVLVSLPVAIGFGWLLARKRFYGKALLEAILSMPLVLPPVTTGYLLLLLFGREGLLGCWLERFFGLRLAFTWYAAVIAAVVVSLPLFIRALRTAFEMVPTSLETAAHTLGCSRLRAFWVITLPLAFPGLISGAVLAFARSLGEFGATITLAGNIAGETRTLPLAMYTSLQSLDDGGGVWWLAGISIALSLGALLMSEWLLTRMRHCQGGVS